MVVVVPVADGLEVEVLAVVSLTPFVVVYVLVPETTTRPCVPGTLKLVDCETDDVEASVDTVDTVDVVAV